tara:strand:+ start:100 stop:513 length:414 start_codon:yes stop_codon:yes gene_type:complete
MNNERRIGFVFITVFFLFITSVSAFPTIITESEVNHTKAVELVYSIPLKYYQYVDRVEFVNDNYAKCKVIDVYGQKQCWIGWYWIYWNKHHDCFNGRIIMSVSDKDLLVHELGHIYEHCNLRRDISTEEYAGNFIIK